MASKWCLWCRDLYILCLLLLFADVGMCALVSSKVLLALLECIPLAFGMYPFDLWNVSLCVSEYILLVLCLCGLRCVR